MLPAVKFATKFLKGETFTVDGFEYQFISVQPQEDWAINITVNVLLPKKGQSFVVNKFDYDISAIVANFMEYFGSPVSYNLKILVDGRPSPERGVYINKEDQDEIINSLNGNMSNLSISYRTTESFTYRIKGDLDWERGDGKFYEVNEEIDFYFYYNVSTVSVNNGELDIKPSKINEFASTLNDKLQDNDYFRDKVREIIYRVLEPSIQIEKLEVYLNANYFLKKINGKEYEPKSPELEFRNYMFIN
jgi:hypothetical protein